MTRYIPDEQIDEALREIDSIAREFDNYEYGLPLGDIDNGKPHAKMRDAIRAVLSLAALQGEPIGEIVRSFSNGSGLDVRLFGKLTSDTPGIVGTKLYAAPAVQSEPAGPVLVQHRKPIAGKDGETTGYTSWIDGKGLDWWPHRYLYAFPAPAQPAVPSDERAEFERAYNRLFRGRGVDTRHISDCEAVWMARAAIPTASYVHDQGSLIHGPE